VDAVKRLYTELDFTDRLSEDLVPKEKIPEMARMAMGRPQLKFNLRKAGEDDLVKIYEKAYGGWTEAFSNGM
jgi:alcohol dehydrogenase class IV